MSNGAWLYRIAPQLLDFSIEATRTPSDDQGDYLRRIVPNPKRPSQILLEIRLEPALQPFSERH